jgi:hypothetical protein
VVDCPLFRSYNEESVLGDKIGCLFFLRPLIPTRRIPPRQSET